MLFVFKSETAGMGGPILAITLIDMDKAVTHRFDEAHLAAGLEMLRDIAAQQGTIVTHSDYHIKKLAKLHGIAFDHVFDTMANAKAEFRQTKNGLGEWADRLELNRGRTFTDAEFWTPALQAHCDQDARIVAALYLHIIDHRTVGA